MDISIFPKNYIVFVIGGQHATKILPNEKIISIIKKVNKPVLLVGGPEDAHRGEEIAKACDKVVNTCGK